jgi:hypothetical protein
LKDSFIGRVDPIFDLGAYEFYPPCEAAVDGGKVVDADAEENEDGDEPEPVKPFFHDEIIHSKESAFRRRADKASYLFNKSHDLWGNFQRHTHFPHNWQ